MRIRKGQVLFSLSSCLSDPSVQNTSSVVQLHSPHQNPSRILSSHGDSLAYKTLDQPNQPTSPIGRPADNRSSCPGDVTEEMNKATLLMVQGKEEKRGEEEKGSNNNRKGSMSGVETHKEAHQESATSSYPTCGGWHEGEKDFPIKKRRGSFERKAKEGTLTTKSKMNKKCSQVQPNDDNAQEDGQTKQNINVEDSNGAGSKKKVRGGALMEGSRCSRVNGRGWRCCQPTLVGYSLCEHHLGKGRLRSMNTVRSKSLGSTSAPKNNKLEQLSSSLREKKHKNDNNEAEDGEEITKKRMKLGMVKARTISSLLEQPINAVELGDDNSLVRQRMS